MVGKQHPMQRGHEGQCAMRGSCGSKDWFGKPLPCPYDGPASEDDVDRDLLVSLCGAEYAEGPSCCTTDQLETLRDNIGLAENIISSCPACRNNFREFWCTFTCSPDQATFLNVTATQETRTGQQGVKSIDFLVSEKFGRGFYDSCKSIQMGATNGYAMDLIGGGAKNYSSFLKFMGDEKDMGSPFQINYPQYHPEDMAPFNATPRNCYDNDLSSRCTCIDCPNICQTLPDIPLPSSGSTCNVGIISCLSFALIIAYGIAVAAFVLGYGLPFTIRKLLSMKRSSYERVALSTDVASEHVSPRTHTRGLVGASSLAQYVDGEESLGTQSDSRNLGRGASLLDPIETVQPRQYRLNNLLRRFFYRLGLSMASSPFLTLCGSCVVIAILLSGWSRFSVETEPVRLWVAPDSESKLQKEFFDEHFGPFYRPQQIFVTAASEGSNNEQDGGASSANSVLSWWHLKYWFGIEAEIRGLRSEPNNYTLDDVCFKPAGPDGFCVVQSVAAWFGNDLEKYDEDTWALHLVDCANSPVECLPDFQQPLAPQYVLGGIPDGEDPEKYLHSEALVITYVLSDSLIPEVQEKAMEWERTLLDYLQRLSANAPSEAGLEVSFSTGVSLKEEINKSTNTDISIVVLSYIAMFLYVSLTLGSGTQMGHEEGAIASFTRWAKNLPKFFKHQGLASSSLSISSLDEPTIFPRLSRKLFVGSKFSLGLFGIALVILSCLCSVGLFSFFGVQVTLIIAEVIPFLVLAVGVDNVFILVHELDRQNLLHGPNAAAATQGYGDAPMSPTQSRSRSQFDGVHSREESVDADAVSTPLYLSAEERVARTLAKMGPSILLSTITETVAFGLGALVPMPAVRNFALYAAGSVLFNAMMQVTVFVSALALDLKRVEASRMDCFPCIKLPSRIALEDPPTGSVGIIARFISRHYAPFLLKPAVKLVVLLTFLGICFASIISMQHIELGFDQRLALPSESYLVSYFDSVDAYLEIGPPVYFVVHDVDIKKREGQQSICGRFTTCDDLSVANVLEAERKRPQSSFIAEPAASWIDDYLNWLNPTHEKCCRVRKRDPAVFCRDTDSPRLCEMCYEDHDPEWNITMDGLPEDDNFMRYLRQWLISPTTEDCSLAGKASFGAALALSEDRTDVVASHFRTFHTPLKSQSDFINSFAAARSIADDLSARTGMSVFPYSLHYVFFDQYAHIIAITEQILGLGLGAVLLVTALMLGSWRTGVIVTGVVGLTVLSVMGIMGVWGIMLNAISLVNLVISLGIAVEFCAHVARAFMSAGSGLPVDHPAGQKERDERMWTALVDVGPSVLSGITFTKLIGMCVLALTRSQFLEIYYFRMWITLIISGALHGLVLLPVVLSYAGGSGFPLQEADEEWMSHAIRHDYEYTPFLADDDSIASD